MADWIYLWREYGLPPEAAERDRPAWQIELLLAQRDAELKQSLGEEAPVDLTQSPYGSLDQDTENF